MPDFECHDCGLTFTADVENAYGTYEFTRCPNCGSGRTTLAPR